jgi:hypothetical protein
MNKPQPLTKEPFHLLLLRALVYTGAVLVFVSPLTTWAGTVAAVSAALAGLLGSRWIAVSRLRWPALVALVAGIVLLGLSINTLLGGPAWVARLLGISRTLAVTEALTFGLVTLGLVVGFRVLALRWRVLALLEVCAVAAAVVHLFASHRDSQISQPRFLSDWAFSHGYDPIAILMGVGVVTVAALALLLLPRQRLRRTLGALAALLVICLVLLLLVNWMPGRFSQGAGGFALGASPPAENPLDFNDRNQQEQQKPHPIALLTLHDDYHPVDGIIHLRNAAHSQLCANRLMAASLNGVNTDCPALFLEQPVTVPGTELPAEWSRAVPTTVAVIAKQEHPMCLVSATAMEPRDNPDPKTFQVVYAVNSVAWVKTAKGHPYQLLTGYKAGDPSWSDAVHEHYLAYPSDPRYMELADRILADAAKDGSLPANLRESPLARGLVIMRWLQKHTTYTLTPGNGSSVDPTADFLFGKREGFCVHFAHGLAFLLRTQGVPTRVATGYAVDEARRGKGSSVVVQSSDGHAWCEIYLQGAGWVVLDASPEQSKSPRPPEPDPGLGTFLQQKLKNPPSAGKNGGGDGGGNDDHSSRQWWLWLLFLVALLYAIKAWRRLAPHVAPAGQLYRVCLRAVLDKLADVGLTRQFAETREEFAQRLAHLAPEFQALTAGHMSRAIAGDERFDRDTWMELKTRIDIRIAAMFSIPRRVVGFLNPVSWLRVK